VITAVVAAETARLLDLAAARLVSAVHSDLLSSRDVSIVHHPERSRAPGDDRGGFLRYRPGVYDPFDLLVLGDANPDLVLRGTSSPLSVRPSGSSTGRRLAGGDGRAGIVTRVPMA
jgi:hypothetical protein